MHQTFYEVASPQQGIRNFSAMIQNYDLARPTEY